MRARYLRPNASGRDSAGTPTSWEEWYCPICKEPPIENQKMGALQVLYREVMRIVETPAAIIDHLEALFLETGGDPAHIEYEFYFSYEQAEHTNRGVGWYVCFYPMKLTTKNPIGYSHYDVWDAIADLFMKAAEKF